MARQRTQAERAFKGDLFNQSTVTRGKAKTATSEDIERQTQEFLSERGGKIQVLPAEVAEPKRRQAYPWLQY